MKHFALKTIALVATASALCAAGAVYTANKRAEADEWDEIVSDEAALWADKLERRGGCSAIPPEIAMHVDGFGLNGR